MRRRVLLIGWDSGDWRIAKPLLESGALPALDRLVEAGVMASSAAIWPQLPALVWSSLVTGTTAASHGVLQPKQTPLSTPPMWELLAAHGTRSDVIGWPDIPLPHPHLRVTPELLDPSILGFFVAEEVLEERRYDPRVSQLARMLARTCTVHNVVTQTLEEGNWEFVFALYPGIGEAASLFGRAFENAAAGDSEFGRVMDAMYRFHDQLLARLMELAGPDATILVTSPCSPSGDGMLILAGPETRRDEILHRCSAFDIAPTILHLLRIAIPATLEGRVLFEAFPDAKSTERATRQSMKPTDAEGLREQWLQWEAFESAKGEPTDTWAGLQPRLNLAIAHITTGRPHAAIPPLQQLFDEYPEEIGVARTLLQAYLGVGELSRAQNLLHWLLEGHERRAWMEYFEGIVELHTHGIAAAAPWFQQSRERAADAPFLPVAIGKALLAHKHWEEAEEAFTGACRLDPGCAAAYAGLAAIYLGMRRNADAAACAARAISLDYNLPFAHYQLARARARQGLYAPAFDSIDTALKLTPGLRGGTRLRDVLRAYALRDVPSAN